MIIINFIIISFKFFHFIIAFLIFGLFFKFYFYLPVDIALIKINQQRTIEWSTSFDFNNNLDINSQIIDYGQFLYLSTSSGASSTYLWLTKMYIDSGIVIMSKWFKYLSNVMIKQTFFSIVFVSDDYMFTLQDSADTEIKLASILIFDVTTFNPLKKFNFDYGTLSTISYFYINQKYYIIGILNNNLQIFIVDSSLNYIHIILK